MLYRFFFNADMNSKEDKRIKRKKKLKEKEKKLYSLERGKRQIFFSIVF